MNPPATAARCGARLLEAVARCSLPAGHLPTPHESAPTVTPDPTHTYPAVPVFADVRDALCTLHGTLCHDEIAAIAAHHPAEADMFHAAAAALARVLWNEAA